MTPADVLAACEVAGLAVVLRADGSPAVTGGRPNAALLAALREHRAGIVALLGGGRPGPETCPGYAVRSKDKAGGWVERAVPCGALVVEAEDTDVFCGARAYCPFRLRAREE